VQPLLPEGVHVNPVSYATTWGDIAHLHLSNLAFAYDNLEPFDHVVLHASNDLYVRQGAPEHIARTRAGFARRLVRPDQAWAQAAPACRDPQLAAVLADLGVSEIYGGQVEGSFYEAGLFREMLDRIGRHFDGTGGGEVYNREEIYFPTLARHLMDGEPGGQVVFVDVLARGPEVSPAVIYGVLDGSLAGVWIGEDLYAVKRVPRVIDHPNRVLIRGMTRTVAGGRRLPVPRTFAGKAFVALAFAVDVLTDGSVVRAWHDAFGPDDDATLAILLDESDGFALPELVDALEAAGTTGPDAADVVLVTTREGSFEEASLRWTTDAVLRPEGAQAPPLYDDRPIYAPERAGELRFLMAKQTGQTREVALRTA
jgi:hypothetical protein